MSLWSHFSFPSYRSDFNENIKMTARREIILNTQNKCHKKIMIPLNLLTIDVSCQLSVTVGVALSMKYCKDDTK